ncbi:MAG: DNA/RNA helicase domain-containing protein [Candidatus Cryptobacteroides sp.]
MIIYRNTKAGFVDDVRSNNIASIIEKEFELHHIPHNNDAEYRSWANSMQYLRNVVDVPEIDNLCQIAIEYQIPLTSKRVDFLISGVDELNRNNVVVIELKQWETSGKTSRADVVTAFTGGADRSVVHPSYQAYSYAKTIENFNENVQKYRISLHPCAYLHNYKESNRSNIDCALYKEALEMAPVFLENDTSKLSKFVSGFVRKRGELDLLFIIEDGRLRPAKALQDALGSMLKGNQEFYLIDEQKVAFETIRKLVHNSLKEGASSKYTIIVEGGPGTGKSIVAIQLLSDLIRSGYTANYVTKNAAPRNVYFEKLRRDAYKQNYIRTLFKGSGSYFDAGKNIFDCLIVDEAHRLQMKSGMFQNLGECQAREIIHASKVSVFFIDEDQVVTTSDVGSVDLIKDCAEKEGSHLIYGRDINLVSQFRCNGSDGYLAFLDDVLGIRETANTEMDIDYDIRIFDSPTKMRESLREKNKVANKARMIAGYCYDWVSKNDKNQFDIILPDGFKAQWNFSDTNTWAIDEDSFEQVGCIHTSQGLEFDYVGVIIGMDLIFRNGEVCTDFTARSKTDKSLKGIKTSRNYQLADRIIRNTYKTILSRGQKGCFIYCEDANLRKYLLKRLQVQQ